MKQLFLLIIVTIVTMGMLSAATITVTNPHSGDTWKKGSTYNITWTKYGRYGSMDANVKIRLYNPAGTKKILEISNSTANDGNFSWPVPNSVANGSYVVRVRTLDNAVLDDSNEFKITRPLSFKPTPGMFAPEVKLSFTAPLGDLKPGTILTLVGKNFGEKKGKILMYGDFTNNPIELVNIQWINENRIIAKIPNSANGEKNQIVKIIVKTSYGIKSKPRGMRFYGREEKEIKQQDGVTCDCGDEANWNFCITEHAIGGWHKNMWGAQGDDVGDDKFFIKLKNGWKFKRMETVKWGGTSSDETLSGPNPAIPVGNSEWNPVIHWKVTPGDKVFYEIRVFVEGPIGTHYK